MSGGGDTGWSRLVRPPYLYRYRQHRGGMSGPPPPPAAPLAIIYCMIYKYVCTYIMDTYIERDLYLVIMAVSELEKILEITETD